MVAFHHRILPHGFLLNTTTLFQSLFLTFGLNVGKMFINKWYIEKSHFFLTQDFINFFCYLSEMCFIKLKINDRKVYKLLAMG